MDSEKHDPEFSPLFRVGETVYAVNRYGGEVERTRIRSITFTKRFRGDGYTDQIVGGHEYTIEGYGSTYYDDDAARYLFRDEADAMTCAAPIRDEARRQSRAESLRRLERTRREVAELEAGLQSHTGTDET